jgi:hypothetical protein
MGRGPSKVMKNASLQQPLSMEPLPFPLSSRAANLPVASGERNDTAKSPWMRGPEGRPPNVSPARKGWESIRKMI